VESRDDRAVHHRGRLDLLEPRARLGDADGRQLGRTHDEAPRVGHTGFTGTSIWIDPTHDLFVVLLTNRVNPTRQNNKIGGVRQAVADMAEALNAAARP